MNISLPLDKMTIEEKIIIMEKIWKDLYQNNAIESPLWHKEIIENRDKDIYNGKEKMLDWKQEKNIIRNSCS